MALTDRVKQGFLRLPVAKKAILIASAVLMLSPLLPWYDNTNSFGDGDTFLGVQGPLFLVGILVAVFGAVSFFNLFFPLMGKNFSEWQRKSGLLAMVLGVQALMLTLVANSVFFHPGFGLNASFKSTRFGMLVAFGSIGVLLLGGYLAHRREASGETEDIEDIMQNPEMPEEVEPEVAPVSYTPQAIRPLSNPVKSETNSAGVDPLSMDPKTRYKLMRQRARMGQNAEHNLWGNQSRLTKPVTDNMKIRTDL